MRLRVWVDMDAGDDLDLFAFVQKADQDGALLSPLYLPGVPFMGAKGQLRASHRELARTGSTPLEPVHHHERAQPVRPGEVVALDIPIWPCGMRWHAGQQLRLVLTGHDLSVPYHPGETPNPNHNAGHHRIHTGGDHDSHLLVPLVEG
jgi:uncharacterized protein